MERAWARRGLLALVWPGIAGVGGLTLVRVAGFERGTPLVQLVAFTPYLLPIAATLAGILLAARLWLPGGVAAVLAVLLVALLLPRALAGTAPQVGLPLRVMSANLYHGQATAALIDLVRREQPDVLSIQELTPEAVAALDAAGIGELLPYRVLRPLPGVAGTGLYARAPLSDRGQVSERTSFEMTRASLDHRGVRLDLVAVHPSAPYLDRDAPSRFYADFARLPAADPADGEVTILAGDFNATLDHRVLRELLGRGYRDAAELCGEGLRTTWGYGRPALPVTIDHILAEYPTGAHATRVHPLRLSDHRAVTTDLLLPAHPPPRARS